MNLSTFITEVFTWWNGQTMGTRLHTWRFGERVGEDEFGNVYYRTKGGKIDPALGFERRWVIFNGVAEATCHTAGLARLDAPALRCAAEPGRTTRRTRGRCRTAPTPPAPPAPIARRARRWAMATVRR